MGQIDIMYFPIQYTEKDSITNEKDTNLPEMPDLNLVMRKQTHILQNNWAGSPRRSMSLKKKYIYRLKENKETPKQNATLILGREKAAIKEIIRTTGRLWIWAEYKTVNFHQS